MANIQMNRSLLYDIQLFQMNILYSLNLFIIVYTQFICSHMEYQLSDQNYEKVLSFMEKKNRQSFEQALAELHHYDFDINMALNGKPANPNPNNKQNDYQQINEDELLNKYINFLETQENQSPNLLQFLFYGIKNLFQAIFTAAAKLVLPQALIIKLLMPKFFGMYYNHLKLPIEKSKLKDLLLRTKYIEQKSVMVVISPKEILQNFVEWANKPDIFLKVHESFKFVGYTLGDRNLQLFDGLIHEPQIIICRMNIFQEVIVIKRFRKNEIEAITSETLNQCFLEGTKLMKKDKKVIKLYRRYQMRMIGYLDESSSEEEESQDNIFQNRLEIGIQNEAYKALEEIEQNKLISQKNQPIIAHQQPEQSEQIRKIRLMSIPEEPKDGSFIRISFRCPDGATIIRNFATCEKVELIFNWIEVNDQIQFEEKSRLFEIMYSYPLKPLSQSKEKLIGDVFEDSQERVIIRQI